MTEVMCSQCCSGWWGCFPFLSRARGQGLHFVGADVALLSDHTWDPAMERNYMDNMSMACVSSCHVKLLRDFIDYLELGKVETYTKLKLKK